LTKEKLIKNYNEKIFKKIITHKILVNFIIESYKKLIVSMLIIIQKVEWTVLYMMKSMQIVKKNHKLLYLYIANVTELQYAIFSLMLVYKELLKMSLSLHFSTLSLNACKFLNFHCFLISIIQWISWNFIKIVTWSIHLLSYLD